MKTASIILLLAVVAAASALQTVRKHEADKTFLMKQKAVLQLLTHVQQYSPYQEIMDISKTYKIEENFDKYDHVERVQKFLWMWKTGKMLKRGEIFTVFDKEQLQQAIMLFDAFYFAKDFDTFWKTAAWARNNMNQGMFVYALSVAVMHREDTKYVILPPPYEIYPHLFFKNDVIQKAYETKMKTDVKTEKKVVVVNAMDKISNMEKNKEARLTYFTEDMDLNTFNMYYHLEFPFWMTPELYQIKFDRRGELFFHMHKQLLNRYQIERMMNNLNQVEGISLKQEPFVGYAPNLRYPNGKDMPVRPEAMKLRSLDSNTMQLVEDLERRIRDVIDMGYVMDKDGKKWTLRDEMGIDILGRMIEETVDTVHPEYYGTLYNLMMKLVGRIVDPLNKHEVAPSALENFQTMWMDPMYYRLMNNIMQLYIRAKQYLPTYTREQMIMQGVKIDSFDTDKLMTYFEQHDVEITNAVGVKSMEENIEIRARHLRINHKPFTYKMEVTSDKMINTMVRVFLVPKFNANNKPLTFVEKQNLIIQLDMFPAKLQPGKNTIERKSRDMTNTVSDKVTFRGLWQQVQDAIEGKTTMYTDETMRHCGMPERFILPMGSTWGKTYQMIVMLTPFEGKNMEIGEWTSMWMCGNVFNKEYLDKYPMGYPFDRKVKEMEMINLPNMLVKDVTIYHKNMEDMNKTRRMMEDTMEMTEMDN